MSQKAAAQIRRCEQEMEAQGRRLKALEEEVRRLWRALRARDDQPTPDLPPKPTLRR